MLQSVVLISPKPVNSRATKLDKSDIFTAWLSLDSPTRTQ